MTSDSEVISLIQEVINEIGLAELVDMEPQTIHACHQAIDDLSEALQRVLNGDSIIAESVRLVGVSWIGPNCIIGPECILGPNSYLCQSALLIESVRVGFNVEVDTAILFQNVKIAHMAYIGCSNLARNVNAGYGFVTTTGRLNREEIKIKLNMNSAKYAVSKASHHGSVIGVGTRFGAEVIAMPGTTVAPGLLVEPRKRLSGIYTGG